MGWTAPLDEVLNDLILAHRCRCRGRAPHHWKSFWKSIFVFRYGISRRRAGVRRSAFAGCAAGLNLVGGAATLLCLPGKWGIDAFQNPIIRRTVIGGLR